MLGREDAPSSAPSTDPPSIKDPVVASDDVVEVPESQASQSDLGERVVAGPTVDDALASSQAPS